ncbi:MAG: type I-C CRISPR-associated protein Cas8c/Csd1, partial [Kiritimatiellia bacterium]
MILQALSQYYQRLLADPDADIAPFGFEKKAIDFLIIIAQNGEFKGLRDLRQGEGKKKKGRLTRVPRGVKRSSGVASNLLWDTVPYALGHLPRVDKQGKLLYKGKGVNRRLDLSKSKNEIKKMRARLPNQQSAFLEKIKSAFVNCEDDGVKALVRFLRVADFSTLFNHPLWQEVEEQAGNITFALEGGDLICQRPAVINGIVAQAKPKAGGRICAVSGEEDELAELHTVIKGVWGAQSSGANIVSFNLDAFRVLKLAKELSKISIKT